MAMEERDRKEDELDGERLSHLHNQLSQLKMDWMGTGLQRQRMESIKMQMAVIRTRMTDQIRLYFSEEKKSDGEAVKAAPDHAHDQADGNFGAAAHGYFEMGMAAHYRPVNAIPPRPGSMQRVQEAMGETKPCPHELCYYNSRSKLATCVACGKKMTPPIYTADDRAFLASLRITLDDPAESGTM